MNSNHVIIAVGPETEIKRFAEDFSLRSGKLDMNTRQPDPLYGGKPSADFGPGKYCIEECSVTNCFFEVHLEADKLVDPVVFYRYIREQYPRLQVIWRYGLEMNGYGYIDDHGEHHYYEDDEEEVTTSDSNTSHGDVPRQLWLWKEE